MTVEVFLGLSELSEGYVKLGLCLGVSDPEYLRYREDEKNLGEVEGFVLEMLDCRYKLEDAYSIVTPDIEQESWRELTKS